MGSKWVRGRSNSLFSRTSIAFQSSISKRMMSLNSCVRHPGRVMRGRDSSGILAADPEDPDDLWPSVSRLAIVVLTKR